MPHCILIALHNPSKTIGDKTMILVRLGKGADRRVVTHVNKVFMTGH